ncbi:MAG: hypothetical protein A07HB70_00958 [uncultured archaeon A07HB70]|nr:MAG: hypothetical protein A07HB70_00958 [uncultured archaeon A07HB70]
MDTHVRPMNRRTVLVAVASALVGGVGGYAAGSTDDGGEARAQSATAPADTPTPTPAPTDTPTPTPAPTDTPTPTPTPTDTPRPYPTRGFDDVFEVTGSSTDLRYIVHGAFRADTVGRFDGTPAMGVYVVLEMTIENRGSGREAVPLREIVLRGGLKKFPDTGATNAAEEDDRIEGESFADVALYAGDRIRGAVVYDVDPSAAADMSVWFTPPDPESDDPTPVVVPIGTLNGLEAL